MLLRLQRVEVVHRGRVIQRCLQRAPWARIGGTGRCLVVSPRGKRRNCGAEISVENMHLATLGLGSRKIL